MVENNRRRQLIALGAEKLADHLLALAAHNDEALSLIISITANPDEIVASFKHKLSQLRAQDYWIEWDETTAFARRLETMCGQLAASAVDASTGFALTVEFFESDEDIMERCDDSDGEVGDVFTGCLTDLFHAFAKDVEDRDLVMENLITLSENNQYGVRDMLVEGAHKSLSHEEMRALVARLKSMIEAAKEGDRDRGKRRMIQSLARQLGDLELYEESILTLYGHLSEESLLTLASLHIARQEYDAALKRLESIGEGYHLKRNKLEREIHQSLGNRERLIALHKEAFDHSKRKEDFEALIAVAGEERREQFLANEVAAIEANQIFQLTDLRFLVDARLFEHAERYLLNRADQIDGGQYYSLLPIAELFLSNDSLLASTLLYRKLLESILRRGYSKAYGYGVEYLCILDDLDMRIGEWGGLEEHRAFKTTLQEEYRLKRSFWSQYKYKKESATGRAEYW